MELEIQPAGRTCAVSGEPFQPGMTMVSILHRAKDGQLVRTDVADGADFAFEGRLVCRWKHRVRAKGEDAANRKRQLEGAEGVFLAFFDDPEGANDGIAEEERDLLRHLLALLLERKRILRRVSTERYWHVRQKRELYVKSVNIDPLKLLLLQEPLALLVEPVAV
ncbi:MAG: hypothetical protein JJT96_11840 [Opitutales bacterium]|nr:hypothetical protein [Opitutales bacterium]